jgi:hypothetical protein
MQKTKALVAISGKFLRLVFPSMRNDVACQPRERLRAAQSHEVSRGITRVESEGSLGSDLRIKNSLSPALSDPAFSIGRALTLESPESGRKTHGGVTYQPGGGRRNSAVTRKRGIKGLTWLNQIATSISSI